MPKRGDCIHKRKDGRWEGRYIKGRNKENKAIYGSVYGKTYSETKHKLDEIKAQFQMELINTKTIRFSDVIDIWLSMKRINIKAATYNKYFNIIETHIKPYLGDYSCTEITSSKINSYITQKLENGKIDGSGGLSPAYVNTIAIVLNSIIDYAISEGYCLPLTTGLLKPTPNSKSPNPLSDKDYSELSKFLKENTDFTKLGMMLSLYAGLRIGEVCALRWKDIDFEKSIVHISATVSRVKGKNGENKLIIDTPKTKSSNRFIPVPHFLMNNLQFFYKKRISEYVISNQETFVNPRILEYRFHKVLNEANINQTNFHALRHTFATKCIEVGMDVKSLSEILGHANSAITLKTYVHSSIEQKRMKMEKLIA